MTLAVNEFGEPGLGGWWTGLVIGFVLVVAVVVVVGTLLALASQIGRQARQAVGLLGKTSAATQPLVELNRTNQTLQSIIRGAVAARQALGG